MSQTVPCRYCNGTGQVAANVCPEIVQGRPCRSKVLPDPLFSTFHPDLARLLAYCGNHRNVRARAIKRAELIARSA